MSDTAITRFTVAADWDAARPLTDAALAAYADHGCLLLRRFAPAQLIGRFREEAATMVGLVLAELGLDATASPIARFDRGLDLLLAADRARVGRLYMAVRKLPSVYALITVPRVWAVMRQLMTTQLPGIYPNGTGVRLDHPGRTGICRRGTRSTPTTSRATPSRCGCRSSMSTRPTAACSWRPAPTVSARYRYGCAT